MSSVFNFNGRSIIGNNITISNGKIIVDGKVVDGLEDQKEINITITGNTDTIKVDNCNSFNIKGDVGLISTVNGSIDIEGDVKGSISTTNGNVDCINVGGNIQTVNGNIKHKTGNK